ncbi:Chromatin-remodeling complexes subunit NGG1 [Coniochaeta hoffmannii]|uniref:Chromatin-remodeling complexes subunit NGG1 n=1 Tax=Coniochaeta hoffmannii TaxID=91930 RepID=A0AA38S3T5_9PEZI|nr:Chromatin-remodeling complexes subunit NGG1 [Coniochaeta hoffmannii]
MPPASSQKGTGKKGGAAAVRQPPRSRNTTPSSLPPTASLPPIETQETETLELRFDVFRNLTYEDLVDSGASSPLIPDSKALDGIVARLQRLGESIERRGNYCDRGMRLLAGTRRTRMDEIAAEGRREDERRQREAEDEERERKANKKKRKATENLASSGSHAARSSPLRESAGGKAKKHDKHDRDNDSASSSLSPVAPRTPGDMDVDDKAKVETKSDDDESSSDDDGRPPPQPRPQANTFGDDPSTFPDPTVYEIRPVKPGMTEDEIKEIYSVAAYPKSDLADLIAGDPPDKDFSSAKPTNQINFSTFSTYIEPFFRPFTEEDLAFLRERGDRVTPFVMPKRGKKHYSEIWAEEDGAMAIDSPSKDKLPPNQPRGSIENMDDDLAETDKLSVGPLLSRLLSAMRPEHRAPPADAASNGANGDGDITMNGVASFDFSFGDSVQPPQPGQTTPNGTVINGVQPPENEPIPPATQMPESNSEAWKKATHPKLDYQQVDERLKQELRHIGFLPSLPGDGASSNNAAANGTSGGGVNGNASSSGGAAGSSGGANGGPDGGSSIADYDGAYDDEVAARLRLLQARLREQALVNGARKARLTELVKERMAHQEYQTILEDLDSQVQAAYLKRTRTMGKKPKKARPGAAAPAAAAGGGLARPGIGDLTKTLMERRRRWIENIGTVFDGENLGKVPRVEDEGSSIFKGDVMMELMKRERENWEEEVEDE